MSTKHREAWDARTQRIQDEIDAEDQRLDRLARRTSEQNPGMALRFKPEAFAKGRALREKLRDRKKETSKRLTRAKPAIRRASSARQQLSNLLHTVESLTTRIPDLERKLATGDGIVDVAHRSRLIQELAKCRAALAEQSSRVEGTQQAAEEAQAEVDKAFADDPDADDSASGGAS